ncbi:hypothetical protein HUT19_16485 [Streptomyces sp. NA02950]|uniref:hypothetical protein n=1 Tax=Streptomyces sp. NA02950 TaxID=2742137 RepID=UPI001591CB69|nr:hypothetical protein [Streptomyces sp. NA02950]QKV93155.1 hypothetical protein HUT19_16485 [Streptomyces sp. NA02950]
MQRRSVRLLAVTLIGLMALTGCGKKGRSHGGGGFGGLGSGGSGGDSPASDPSGLPSGVPTDLPSGVPSYTPGYPTPSSSYSYSAPSTYNPDATTETSGSNCRYDQSTGQFKYDVRVTNTDSSRSFRYSVSVSWNEYGDDGLLGYDSQYVTVLPGQSETITATANYTITKRTQYTCQVSMASKSPTS